jgi:hypothetical protein
MEYFALSTIDGSPIGLKLPGLTESQAIESLCTRLTQMMVESPNCLASIESFESCAGRHGVSRAKMEELSESPHLYFIRSVQRCEGSDVSNFCDNWDIWLLQRKLH